MNKKWLKAAMIRAIKWKDVVGYEGIYEVSNNGDVRNKKTKRILKLQTGNTKYLKVHLSKNGVSKWELVHRLVGKAFIRNDNKYNIINHLDNNPLNNKVENLEWTTYKGNMQHASKQGRMKCNPNNLRKAQEFRKRPVIAIDRDGKEYEFSSQVEAAKKLNCSRGHIASICKNEYGYKTSNGYSFRYKEV